MDSEKSLREMAGIWKDKPKEDSVVTVRKMRVGWESRRKRVAFGRISGYRDPFL